MNFQGARYQGVKSEVVSNYQDAKDQSEKNQLWSGEVFWMRKHPRRRCWTGTWGGFRFGVGFFRVLVEEVVVVGFLNGLMVLKYRKLDVKRRKGVMWNGMNYDVAALHHRL